MLVLAPSAATLREAVQAINQLIVGRNNAVRTIVLEANSTTTTISDREINANGAPFLSPKTASAAAEVPTLYVSDVSPGSYTLTHTSSGATDREFYVLFTGG